jgi:hypothetical protein
MKPARRVRTASGSVFAPTFVKELLAQVAPNQHFDLPFCYAIGEKVKGGPLNEQETGSIRCQLQRLRDKGRVQFIGRAQYYMCPQA